MTGTEVRNQAMFCHASFACDENDCSAWVQGTKITDNLFTRLDGNAIFLGGYHRDLLISNNEFEYIGDSAMASWGDTSGNLNANGSVSVPYAVGPDGRDGNQNRGARIVGNVAREVSSVSLHTTRTIAYCLITCCAYCVNFLSWAFGKNSRPVSFHIALFCECANH
jgi:hypothetical protein